MAKHDGNCCCSNCAAKRYVRDSERAVRELYGSGTDTTLSGFGDCPDCSGTGDCSHCKNGIYYKRNGQSAGCGKCRGRLKCHSCRGKGRGGRECRVPRYVEPGKSRWTPAGSRPPDVGVVADTDHVASFKTSGDETLIADGDYSDDNRGFGRANDGTKNHNHYGRKREGGGRFSRDRGKYTGPGH